MKEYAKFVTVYILTKLSKLILKKYKPKIVVVTGSVGKTSTKDAIYTAISPFAHVRKSEKSYNSEIGIPLTILGAPNGWSNPSVWLANILGGISLVLFKHKYPEWLVLEVGVGKPGDMKKIASWLRSDVVVITHFGTVPVHIEFFASKSEIVKEKKQLINTLKKDGLLLLHSEDKDVHDLKHEFGHLNVRTYGFGDVADIKGTMPQIIYEMGARGKDVPVGMSFRVDISGNSVPINITGGLGMGHLSGPLAGIALVVDQKWNIVEASKAFEEFVLPQARMRLVEGREGSTIIDDTYNSSPAALRASIDMLGSVETKGRKIAVLGDMLELGKHTEEEHLEAGRRVSKVASILYTIGPRAEFIAKGAIEAGLSEDRVVIFRSLKDAIEPIRDIIGDTDVILVKGSQSMRMERLVEAIMAHPENKANLLCRQEEEWLKRV
jgi:UDP-N-acetylmuramoyl-tripeptide--D-alanyl-D-alanine ligase